MFFDSDYRTLNPVEPRGTTRFGTLTRWWTGQGSVLEAYDEDGWLRFRRQIVVPSGWKETYVISIDELVREEGKPFVSRRNGTLLTFENATEQPLARIAYDFRWVDIGESLTANETIVVKDVIFGSYVVRDGVKHQYCDGGRSLKTNAWDLAGTLVYEQAFTCDEIAAMDYRIRIQ